MKKILITGAGGIIGSACVKKFINKGWYVIGIDNNMRKKLFGKDGSTASTIKQLLNDFNNLKIINIDIRDHEKMIPLVEKADAVIHAAAQPSHPLSLERPMIDFQINAFGTLNLLELVRQYNKKIPFLYLSSNKVYGDYPNYFNYKIINKRYENTSLDSFDETLPIDRCGHTPFGVSKAAADLYCQEYAVNYGLITATFRGGCLIGTNQKAVEMHGFLGFFTKMILLKKPLTIYGGGYRVRDNIEADDVADVLYLWVSKPKPDPFGKFGKPYNLGGMRENSISIFETIDAIEAKTGIKAIFKEECERESDHIWWISDMSKFKKDYPEWKGLKSNLDTIFNELLKNWINTYNSNIKLKEKNYLKTLNIS